MLKSVLIVVCGLIPLIQAGYQSVGARGTVMCGDKPLVKAVVKLWDHHSLLPDKVLGCTHTDDSGNFEVQGKENEILENIDPVLKIYTNCNDQMLWGAVPKPCEREIKMTIPKGYLNSGDTVTHWYEFNTMNIEAKMPGEKRKCEIFDLCDTLLGRIE